MKGEKKGGKKRKKARAAGPFIVEGSCRGEKSPFRRFMRRRGKREKKKRGG